MFRNENGPTVPETCCKSLDDDPIRRACQGKQPRREDTHYEVGVQLFAPFLHKINTKTLTNSRPKQQGCYERMKEFVKSHALLVGGMAIGVSCLIIFGMVLSCALYMMIK